MMLTDIRVPTRNLEDFPLFSVSSSHTTLRQVHQPQMSSDTFNNNWAHYSTF
jgi:hypothetical protein